MIKALIFDLDNTLIDRQRAFKEMLYRVLSNYFNDQDLIEKMIIDILEYDQNGKVPRIVAFTKWAEKYQITNVSPQELADNWSKESGNTTFLYPDVRETLTKLKTKYKIAVLSNGNQISQRRKMNSIAIDDLLDYSLISGEFGIDKPDRKIFDYTCKQLNLNNNECIYVGDTYAIDIVGARNAGLEAIYVSRNNEIHTDVLTIHEIHELLDILK